MTIARLGVRSPDGPVFPRRKRMASRRILSDAEERALAKSAEAARDASEKTWNLDAPKKVTRGSAPTAVLSVRLPLDQVQALRKIASITQRSLSEMVQGAVTTYIGTGGPALSTSDVRGMYVAVSELPVSGTAQLLMNEEPLYKIDGAAGAEFDPMTQVLRAVTAA
jgi:hypothetical protein